MTDQPSQRQPEQQAQQIPALTGIDHFHLYVENKQTALKWYKEILGFRAVDAFADWNTERGPLTIEDSSGTIHLALFTRDKQPPVTSIAFKASGEQFLLWQAHFAQHQIKLRVADHQLTWSMYFKDPDGNMHEITTDEHQYVTDNIVQY